MKKLCLLLLLPMLALAGPPYDVTVTFDAPLSGGSVDGYNFFIDDCAISGPGAAPFASVVSGQTFVGAITADGTYLMCVRPFNATGELADPGPVASVDIADLPLPGPVENLDVQISCPVGGCTVTITVN